MTIRAVAIATCGLAAAASAQAMTAAELAQSAREACLPQIERSFDVLSSACTAAAIIDLATTPENPSCVVAQGIINEYIKACMEHAAALIHGGEPVVLPPFPDLGSQIVVAPERPSMPDGWPGELDLEDIPLFAAALKHEALNQGAGMQLRVLMATALTMQPEVLILDEPTSGLQDDAEIGPVDSSSAAATAADEATSK